MLLPVALLTITNNSHKLSFEMCALAPIDSVFVAMNATHSAEMNDNGSVWIYSGCTALAASNARRTVNVIGRR
jgi:hypothetical protein